MLKTVSTLGGGGGNGSGTVTSVSVTSGNGFAGTVANPTSTPAITISTTVGTAGTPVLLQGNGTAITAVTIGSGISFTGGTLSATGGSGTVTQVQGNGTVNGITLTGNVTTSGNLTLGGTLSGIENSQLSNSTITLGNATLTLGSTTSTVGNLTLQNVTVNNVASTFPNSFLANSTATLGNTTVTLGGTTATVGGLRITPRVSTTTSSATPTINTDTVDIYGLTAQTVDITSFTTNLSGTPTDGQKLWIYIVGTAARAITWGTSFESSTVTLPTTTVTTNRLDVGFVWNAATSKWRCVATA